MPAAFYALGGLLIQIAGTLVGQVLLSLGIGFATFTGVSASLTWARDLFVSSFSSSSLPVGFLQLMGLLQVGSCVSMLLAALTVRLTLQGLTAGGALHRMVQRAPS